MAQPVGQAAPARERVGIEPGRAERGQPVRPIRERHDEHEPEPVPRHREQRDRGNGERARLPRPDGEAEQVAQDQGGAHERECRRHRIAQEGAYRSAGGDALAPVPAGESAQPDRILRGERPIEAEGAALDLELRGCGGRPEQTLHRVPRREPHQQERERDDPGDDDGSGQGAGPEVGEHAPNLARPAEPR